MEQPVTALLARIRAGDSSAYQELMPVVYEELRRIARKHLSRERPGHTLQPTALVNEAYLRIVDYQQAGCADRAHFLALASRIMRQILVDHARARLSDKRGGDGVAIAAADIVDASTEEGAAGNGEQGLDLLDLDLALEALAQHDPQAAEIVGWHYFGGLTAAEAAEASGRSVHVVQHELRYGRAWLRRRLDR